VLPCALRSRRFPGNPGDPQGTLSVICNDPSKTLRVRIIDSCPCTQVGGWAGGWDA
jgi:hypothetical protein